MQSPLPRAGGTLAAAAWGGNARYVRRCLPGDCSRHPVSWPSPQLHVPTCCSAATTPSKSGAAGSQSKTPSQKTAAALAQLVCWLERTTLQSAGSLRPQSQWKTHESSIGDVAQVAFCGCARTLFPARTRKRRKKSPSRSPAPARRSPAWQNSSAKRNSRSLTPHTRISGRSLGATSDGAPAAQRSTARDQASQTAVRVICGSTSRRCVAQKCRPVPQIAPTQGLWAPWAADNRSSRLAKVPPPCAG